MCLTPIKVKARKNEDGMIRMHGSGIVPCGKCPKCKQRRANAWIFRLLQQEKNHRSSLFVTLTYSPETVPISKRGFMTLCKRDFQLFMKRLRKATGIKTIKYYACGEYGTDTWRPHYHAIMFDVTKDQIAKAWPNGHIHIGQVTGASIGYTTKYICKDKRVPVHSNDDRVPEFSLMSKNLGKNYLTPQMVNWHRSNKASFVIVDGGFKQPLPRYYRDFIFTTEDKVYLNYLNQKKHMDDFNNNVKHCGSVLEFYRVRFDQVKQIIMLSKQREKQNRNKI